MASVQTETVLDYLRRFASRGPATGPDQDLVQRFATQADDNAFAALLARHGPMVLHVCRRVLHHSQDAEDAFQATFLVLARKAASLQRRESVGNWLYGVAYRVALNARAAAARRAAHEARAIANPTGEPLAEISLREAHALLDEEMSRLSERYRAPLVLCCLEGMARDEAARQLGWSLGTLKRRLERGRELLRTRLTRRGLTLPAAFGAALLGQGLAQAELPVALGRATLQAVVGNMTGTASLSQTAFALADGMGKAMTAMRLKLCAAVLLAISILAASAGLLVHRPMPAQQTAAGAVKPDAGQTPSVRVDRYGDPLPDEALARLGTARLRHGNFVEYLRFTPDGKTLVSQSYDGVRVWDSATGAQRHFFQLADTAREFGANAFLSADGKRVAMPGKSGIGIWDVDTGKLLRTVGAGRYERPCFSPDGKILAGVFNDRNQDGKSRASTKTKVVLWNAASGNELKAWNAGVWINAIAFSPDGKHLLINCTVDDANNRGRFVRIWDVRTGKEQRRIMIPSVDVPRMAVSPDGTLLAAIVYREPRPGEPKYTLIGRVQLWDVTTGQFVREMPFAARNKQPAPRFRPGSLAGWSYHSVAFTPDGKELYAGGVDNTLIVWDPRTGKELRRVGADLPQPFAICFTRDGKTVATNLGPMIRLIDLRSGADLLPELKERMPVKDVAVSADGRTVVTADSFGLRIWDSVSGREVRRLDGKRFGSPIHLARDGRTLLTLETDEDRVLQTWRTWDLAAGREWHRTGLKGQPGIRAGAISPAGKTLAGIQAGGVVSLTDLQTGKELRRLTGHGGWVQGTAFTAGGRGLAVWDSAGRAHLWNLREGREVIQFRLPEGGEKRPVLYKAALSPDGKYFAFASQRKFIVLYDLETGEAIWKLDNLLARPDALTFTPDSKALAWGGYLSPTIHLIELATARSRRQFAGHRGEILALAFSADGKSLVSTSNDTTALVWDLTGRLATKGVWGKPLTTAELDTCWADLACQDAAKAYRAIRRLAASPAEAIPYLQKCLRPVAASDEKPIARLIRDLESARFTVRDRAAKELEKLGEAATGPCRKALASASTLEMRRRLEGILKVHRQAWHRPTPESLRALRALEILEHASTAEARRLLGRLAQGAPEARLTQAAQASLQRLAR